MNDVTITYLEMTDPAQLQPKPCDDPRFRIAEMTVKQWQVNRMLYDLVGADWTWHDKLDWTEDQWRAYVEDVALRTFIAHHDGSMAGYFELDRRDGAVQIAYLGLTPPFIGCGLGGALVTRAIREAWAMRPSRVWLHTCTLDHPAALGNYLARGMTVFKTESA